MLNLPIPPQDILGFPLNTEQQTALEEILTWAFALDSDPYYILSGFAGTGKTTLIKLLTRYLTRVVLCAPTNKAVRVLKSLGTTADCCTIYSLLGLQMEQHEDVLKLTKAERDRVGRYEFILLDEAGMTNTVLLDYIEKAASRYRVKVLFIGDPKQLNPVGESISPIWGRYDCSRLSMVERHDNQILTLVTAIRRSKLSDLVVMSNNDNASGVWYHSPSEFISTIKEYASRGDFASSTRAIAWRNKTVDKLNRIIRAQIYGDAARESMFSPGDRIVFTSPHKPSEDCSIITDDEAAVTNVVVSEHTHYTNLLCYYLTVTLENGYSALVKVIHEDYLDKLSSMLTSYANDARNRKLPWSHYWELKNSLATVKHGYALTAHRSQGSTYVNVFVDMEDICSNSNRKEARRALYVACSRSTTQLHLM